MTDKESYVNVADLKRKLRAFAKYRQYSKPTTDELLGVVSKLKISIKADLETTLESTDVQPVNQWISVKERLPETPEEGLGVRYSDCCLVCDSHDWCGMAYYLTDDKKSWWEFADAQNKVKIDWTEVTHWMPLPEPPKDGET